MSDTENNSSYFGISNLAMREGGLFASAIDLQSSDGGVYDIYGSGLSAPRLRVNSGTTVLNLRAQNVLDNLSAIDFDSNNACTLKINADMSNAVNILTLRSNSTLELSIAEEQTLLVKSLRSREGEGENMSIIFRNYNDGSFMLGSSDPWIEDNRLYLPSTDAYVNLVAYDRPAACLKSMVARLERRSERAAFCRHSRTRRVCGNIRRVCIGGFAIGYANTDLANGFLG